MCRSCLVSRMTLIMAASSLFSSKPGYPAVRLVSPHSIMFSASLTGILLFRVGSMTTVVLGLKRPLKDLFIIGLFRGDSMIIVVSESERLSEFLFMAGCC